MSHIRKEQIGRILEHIAKKHVDSISAICFYEPAIPESLKTGLCKKESLSDLKYEKADK